MQETSYGAQDCTTLCHQRYMFWGWERGSFIGATFFLHSVGLTTESRCDCLLVLLITKPCFLHRMLADAVWDKIIGYLAAQSGDHQFCAGQLVGRLDYRQLASEPQGFPGLFLTHWWVQPDLGDLGCLVQRSWSWCQSAFGQGHVWWLAAGLQESQSQCHYTDGCDQVWSSPLGGNMALGDRALRDS